MGIWSSKKKGPNPAGPQLQDSALADLSRMFIHCPSDPTPGVDLLQPLQFDFTLKSLAAMDAHLEQMRTRKLSDRDRFVFILRSGAYVGEIVRRFTPPPKEWHWLGYKQAASIVAFVASLGMSAETSAVLWDGKGGVLFPLAKVSKYLQNGAEDSVLFYAQVLIAGPPPIVPQKKSPI
jgi:hypothetical protein